MDGDVKMKMEVKVKGRKLKVGVKVKHQSCQAIVWEGANMTILLGGRDLLRLRLFIVKEICCRSMDLPTRIYNIYILKRLPSWAL